jgi:S1-C subfamily serine protease
VDKLNLSGMHSLAQLTLRVILRTAESEETITFRDRATVENEKSRAALFAAAPQGQPRLGIRWKRGDSAADGIAVTHVSAESAADRAGLRVGDRIQKWGSFPAVGAFDFRSLVLATKKSTTITVLRSAAAQSVMLPVELDGQPQRFGISWRDDPADPTVVVLTQVVPGSPSAVAGLQILDRILSVNGASLTSSADFLRQISGPQEVYEVECERAGRLKSRRILLVPETASAAKTN